MRGTCCILFTISVLLGGCSTAQHDSKAISERVASAYDDLASGDSAGFRTHFVGTEIELDLVEAFAELLNAMGDFEARAIEVYGRDAWDTAADGQQWREQLSRRVTPVPNEVFVVTDGDTALARIEGEPRDLLLLRHDGDWKLHAGDWGEDEAEQVDDEIGLRLLRQLTAVFREFTDEHLGKPDVTLDDVMQGLGMRFFTEAVELGAVGGLGESADE